MSTDYQLAHTTTPPPTDFWTQGGSAVLAPPPTPPASGQSVPPAAKLSPATKAHRLLRGRYPLAITLAAAGAAAGCIGGYLAVAPRYAAMGSVVLDPRVITPDLKNDTVDQFNTLLSNTSGFLTSATVADAAMADPAFVKAYHAAYPGQPLPDDPTFENNVTVDKVRGSTLLNVTYADRSKRVAETADVALLTAYEQKYATDDATRGVNMKLDFNRQRLDRIGGDLQTKRAQLDSLVKQSGGEPAVIATHEKFVEDASGKADSDLAAARQTYDDAKEMAVHGSGGANDNELVYQEINNRGDRNMAAYLAAREQARSNFEDVQARGFLQASALYQEQARRLQQAKQRVEEYARTYVAVNPAAIPTPMQGTGAGLTSLDMMKRHLDQMQATSDNLRAEETRLASAKERMSEVQADISRLSDDQTNITRVMQELQDSQQLTKTILVSMPGEATLQTDRRKAAAGGGLLLGGLLPLGLMMMYGMRDSRFRYSDETTEADLAGVALLGILPNLPDRLSDPQQAGIAAHCVHQIRTMLQISRANDEPQVIAVTSASTGDGKTSLTLALGLSYAACGARTLLIDCDLLAAGLTHRLNVSSPDGVLEAVANRALLEYVRTTDIADVAILPVGTTHAHHASTLSPVALRRLLSEAKKQFDIVIVDTGPILASIEASLICAAADRTILTVARNQQRPLVERSIGHLQAIGASLAGVVFNRAQAKDFEKSMSGLALRSRPAPGNAAAAANSPNGQQVAKAVAGSFKRAG